MALERISQVLVITVLSASSVHRPVNTNRNNHEGKSLPLTSNRSFDVPTP